MVTVVWCMKQLVFVSFAIFILSQLFSILAPRPPIPLVPRKTAEAPKERPLWAPPKTGLAASSPESRASLPPPTTPGQVNGDQLYQEFLAKGRYCRVRSIGLGYDSSTSYSGAPLEAARPSYWGRGANQVSGPYAEISNEHPRRGIAGTDFASMSHNTRDTFLRR